MDILPLHFRTFQIFGLWYANTKKFLIVKIFYRLLMLIFIFQFTFIQLFDFLSINVSVKEITERIFLFLTYVANFYKMVNFIMQNKNINELLNKFRLEHCQPRKNKEKQILSKYQNTALRTYILRMMLTITCATVMFIVPIIRSHRVDLPFNTYFFNVKNSVQFISAYLLQIFPIYGGIIIDVCLDSTSCAFIILTCGQLDLCCYRITSMDNSTRGKSIDSHVRHHVLIQNIVRKIQSSFNSIIIPVFCFGLITLSTSIYQLSQQKNTIIEFVAVFTYLGCLLCQIYNLCWFGNELTVKSKTIAHAIYECDWTTLKPSERRNYWFMMFIGQNELRISYHGQCTLTLGTFLWMVKTAYGAFNLLQQVSRYN